MAESPAYSTGIGGEPRRAGLIGVGILALGLWLWATVPLALGERTLFLRDVFSTHLPAKAFGAAVLAEGRIPAFNPAWGLGAPFRGNPNVLPFYPGNLLYLVLPFWSAFNLHYALHWLLAAVAMAALACTLGQSREAALLAGLTYAGSGWMLSALTFYNILTVSAWWPLVLRGAAAGGRRGVALGGLACGLALLGGEPVTAALGLVPLLLVAVERQGWRRGVFACLGIGGLGLLLALPQGVATARVLGFTFRGAFGGVARNVPFVLDAARLAELVVPFPFGWPWRVGAQGFISWDGRAGLPYVLTLHVGIVALWLAALALRRHWRWGALAAAGLFLAWAGAFGGDALVAVSGGLMRYPEKLVFWFALAAPLLAGWGLERAVASGAWRSAFLAAVAGLAGAAALFAGGRGLVRWIAAHIPLAGAGGAARMRLGVWVLGLALAALLLAVASLAARRRSGWGLAAAQLAALLPLAGLVATAPVDDFVPGPWLRQLPSGAGVVTSNLALPLAGPLPGYRLRPEATNRNLVRLAAFDLGAAPGTLHGLRYPLAPDLDGMQSPLAVLLLRNLPGLDWTARARWLRVLGIDAAVLEERPTAPDLLPIESRDRFGGTSGLYRVRGPAPPAWWPRSVTAPGNPVASLQAVSRSADPVADAVSSQPVDHRPGARVRLLSESPDAMEVEVAGDGGLLVLRRVYHPLYQAEAAGRPLPTFPVELSLLGVEVPAGTHRVRLTVSSAPEMAAGAVSLLALLGTLALALRRGRG